MPEQTPTTTPAQTSTTKHNRKRDIRKRQLKCWKQWTWCRSRNWWERKRNYFQAKTATNIQAIIDADRDYQGSVPEVGVLGLPNERNLQYGLQLDDFNDAILSHVGENYTKGEMLKTLIMNLEDPEKEIVLNTTSVPDKDTDPGGFERWKI